MKTKDKTEKEPVPEIRKVAKIVISQSSATKTVREADVIRIAKQHCITKQDDLALLMGQIEDGKVEIQCDFHLNFDIAGEDRDLSSIRLYFKDVSSKRLLTRREETELARLAKKEGDAGKEALDKLVTHNLRLVIPIAKRYMYKEDLMDLIQAGNMGLMHAAKKFDPERGFKFSTYATWWIRQYIVRSISDTCGMIKMPAYVREGLGREIDAFADRREHETGLRPDAGEIAVRFSMTPETVSSILAVNIGIDSLDKTLRRDGSYQEITIGDMLKGGDDVEYQAMRERMRDEIITVIGAVLTERELDIILMYFGLKQGRKPRKKSCGEMSLSAIGNELNLTRERIRQIKKIAMEKLQSSPLVIEKLYAWLDGPV